MEALKVQIEQQVQYNNMLNLFCEEAFSNFGFSPATVTYVKENLPALRTLAPQEEEALLDELVNKAIESLCQANQFYYFNSFDRAALRKIYLKLLAGIRALPDLPEEGVEAALDALAKRHYRNLQFWMKKSNPFGKSLYASTEPLLKQEVVCGEYAAQTQLQLLQMDINNLHEPILDLGCGKQSFLVNHLRSLGIDAYGVDRNVAANSYLFQADWFEFELSCKSWGTIISNLGFSNHFQHHHLRVDGDYNLYAIRYMEILYSLKPGGAFYYAPDLPFIEQHLDPAKFQVHKAAVENTAYKATKVIKL